MKNTPFPSLRPSSEVKVVMGGLGAVVSTAFEIDSLPGHRRDGKSSFGVSVPRDFVAHENGMQQPSRGRLLSFSIPGGARPTGECVAAQA